LLAKLVKKRVHAIRCDGVERHPVDTRGTVVLFRHLIGGAERLSFADVPIQTPKSPLWFSLRLDVQSSSQILLRDGCLCHLTPASRCRRLAMQQGPFARRALPASSLLRTWPPPSRLQSTSRHHRLYDRSAPSMTRWDEDGFSSRSTCPCHRAAPYRPAGVA